MQRHVLYLGEINDTQELAWRRSIEVLGQLDVDNRGVRQRSGEAIFRKQRQRPRLRGAFLYPAVQNMLLAARALYLGATLTTLYLQFEKEAEAALGLPPGVRSYALIPIGYPMGRFGPVRRIALADVVYEDHWG